MKTSTTITDEGSLTDASVSTSIVDAVAEEAGVEPTALPPLYETIDPDALNGVVRGSSIHQLTVSYYGYTVSINGEGHVHVRSSTGPPNTVS